MPEYDEGTAYEEIGTAEVSMSDVMDDAPADDPDDNYLEDVVTEDPFGFDFDFDGATTSPTCVVGRDSDRAAWEGWCRFGGGVGWVLGAVFMEMAAGERENRKKIAMARAAAAGCIWGNVQSAAGTLQERMLCRFGLSSVQQSTCRVFFISSTASAVCFLPGFSSIQRAATTTAPT